MATATASTKTASAHPTLLYVVACRDFPWLSSTSLPVCLASIVFSAPISVHDIVESLTQAACQCFNIELLTQPLSKEEWQIILNNLF